MSAVECIGSAIVLNGSKKCFKAEMSLNKSFNHCIIHRETLPSKKFHKILYFSIKRDLLITKNDLFLY